MYRALLLIALSGSPLACALAAVPVVDAKGLVQLAAERPDLIVIDLRPAGARREGYIEGSLSLSARFGCDALRRVASRAKTVVFYCDGLQCGAADNAVAIARGCGYGQIYSFRGGVDEWIARGYPVLKD